MAAKFRLSSTMVSRKTQALRFIKEYFAEWAKSPSLGEIGNALGTSRQRAGDLVRQLELDGDIVRRPGDRGILLPEPAEMISRTDALLILKAAGWKIEIDGSNILFPANDAFPLTLTGLPMLPELDHIPDIEPGVSQDGHTDS